MDNNNNIVVDGRVWYSWAVSGVTVGWPAYITCYTEYIDCCWLVYFNMDKLNSTCNATYIM